MARHRIHSLAFKKQVVQEYAAGVTLNGLAREYDLSRNLIRIWIAKCESGEFDPDIEAATLLADHEAKIATLERMGRSSITLSTDRGGALHSFYLPWPVGGAPQIGGAVLQADDTGATVAVGSSPQK